MFIFGDESGDSGMRTVSSPKFTLAFTMFESSEAVALCEQGIEQLKTDLGVREFHWVHCSGKIRNAFLTFAREQKFRYYVQTTEKAKLVRPEFKRKPFFYDRFCEKVALGLNGYLQQAQDRCAPDHLDARVVLDHNGDRDFITAVKRNLRTIKRDGRSLIGKVTTRRSIADNLLQLTDMVCGAVLHPPHGQIIAAQELAYVTWP